MVTLIIDNKQGYGRKLKRLLEKEIANCSVTVRSSALEALSEVRNPVYDLLIIGHELPEASVDDFITLLNNTGRKIPVLIIVHNDDNDTLVQNDSLESCIFHVSANAVFQILPFVAMETHKRCQLSRENQELKKRLVKAEVNHNITDIVLNSNHKINNPLMTIMGNTQLLLQDTASFNQNTITRLEKIEQAARKIQEITLDLANDLGSAAEPKDMLKPVKK
jgi:signal transduction histidine kinase